MPIQVTAMKSRIESYLPEGREPNTQIPLSKGYTIQPFDKRFHTIEER
jgi:hypothetical protein